MRFHAPRLAVLLALMAGTAEATPFTYEFILPNWTEVGGSLGSSFGTHGIVTLTVDNGLTSPSSQYTFAEVKEIRFFAQGSPVFTLVVSDAFAELDPSSSLMPTDVALTTDVAGFGYLDFSKNDTHVARWSSTTTTPTEVSSQYAIFNYGTDSILFGSGVFFISPHVGFAGSASVSDLSLIRSTSPQAVPEPASLLLLAVGCGSIVLICRTRQSG